MTIKFLQLSLSAMAIAALTLVSCNKDDTQTEAADAPALTVSKAAVSASNEGGTYKFTYSISNPAADGVLTCSADEAWISVTDYSSGTVTYAVGENSTEQIRTGHIVLTYSYSDASVSEQVLVVQNAINSPSLTVQPSAVVATKAGGDYTFGYEVEDPLGNGSLSCEADVDWIGSFDYTSDGTVGFTVSESTSGEMRTGEITVSYANSNGAVSEIVSVVQEAADVPALSASKRNMAISCLEGTYEFTYEITNPIDDGVVSFSTEESWLSIISYDDGTVRFKAVQNDSDEKRSCYIYFTYTYWGDVTSQLGIYVTQNATPSLTLSVSEVEAYYKGYSYSFTYYVYNPEDDGRLTCSSDADWIGSFDYSTDGTIGYTVAANETSAARSATVTVTYSYGTAAISEHFTVTQDITGPEYDDLIGTYEAVGGAYVSTGYAEEKTWTLGIYKDEDDPLLIIMDGLVPSMTGTYPASEAYIARASMNDDGQIVIERQFTGYYNSYYGGHIGWLPCIAFIEEDGWYVNMNYTEVRLTYDEDTAIWTSDYGFFLTFFSTYGDFTTYSSFYDVTNPGFTIRKTSSATPTGATSASVKELGKGEFHTDFKVVK